jgi:redox-sensitive bicupin YhaK (pirin superfamily)
VVAGRIEHEGVGYRVGQMLVFGAAGAPVLHASEASTLMLLGGEPLGERHIWWNFVSSRRERIEQAKADWKAGRIALPPNDAGEFIPLPEDRR